MSAACHTKNSPTKATNIQIRRVLLSDPSQVPSDLSSTPGGTLFSTTPGGTRIVYDRAFLLECRNSPLANSPPVGLPAIPGVTCQMPAPAAPHAKNGVSPGNKHAGFHHGHSPATHGHGHSPAAGHAVHHGPSHVNPAPVHPVSVLPATAASPAVVVAASEAPAVKSPGIHVDDPQFEMDI
jgi:translation initiation factor 4E binding protein 1